MATIKKMNNVLFKASFHLMEAGKYLSNVEEFREESGRLLEMAAEMAAIIQPEEEKVAEDRMKSILAEIMQHSKEAK